VDIQKKRHFAVPPCQLSHPDGEPPGLIGAAFPEKEQQHYAYNHHGGPGETEYHTETRFSRRVGSYPGSYKHQSYEKDANRQILHINTRL
jgi:hypothetical protein